MEALPKLKFKIVDNSQVTKLSEKEAKKKEKEILENTQIRVVFPSKLTVKSKNDKRQKRANCSSLQSGLA